MRAWFHLVVVACGVGMGCVRPDAFVCDQDLDCVRAAGAGHCEETSYCSYDDALCSSRRRYSELAGPFAGECVMPEDVASSSPTGSGDTDDDVDVADDGGATEATPDDGSDDDGGAPTPSDGHLVWSRLVSHPSGGSDRFGALLITGDRIVAAGQQRTDLSIVALAAGSGDIVAQLVHDVGGSDDAVHALALGDGGELVACGRNDDAILGVQAWIGTVDAALSEPPLVASFWRDHTCHAVVPLDAERMIAAGEGLPFLPGPRYAWLYAFERDNPTLGTVHENEGEQSVWHTAAHVSGIPMFGGRLGASAQAGKGVVAGLDGAESPSQFAVFSDALWAVHGLVPDAGGFVLGGFESTAGAATAWVSAHTQSGSERWSWRPGDAPWPTSSIEAVAVDSQGFTVAVGFVSDGSDQQRWIVRLDPDGTLLWSYALPNEMTGGRDLASAVAILPGDDIVVVGEAEVAPGETDAWVARFSPDDA